MFVKEIGLASLPQSLLNLRQLVVTWFIKTERNHEAELAERRLRRDLRRIAEVSPHLLADAGFEEDPCGSGAWHHAECAYIIETSHVPSVLPARG